MANDVTDKVMQHEYNNNKCYASTYIYIYIYVCMYVCMYIDHSTTYTIRGIIYVLGILKSVKLVNL